MSSNVINMSANKEQRQMHLKMQMLAMLSHHAGKLAAGKTHLMKGDLVNLQSALNISGADLEKITKKFVTEFHSVDSLADLLDLFDLSQMEMDEKEEKPAPPAAKAKKAKEVKKAAKVLSSSESESDSSSEDEKPKKSKKGKHAKKAKKVAPPSSESDSSSSEEDEQPKKKAPSSQSMIGKMNGAAAKAASSGVQYIPSTMQGSWSSAAASDKKTPQKPQKPQQKAKEESPAAASPEHVKRAPRVESVVQNYARVVQNAPKTPLEFKVPKPSEDRLIKKNSGSSELAFPAKKLMHNIANETGALVLKAFETDDGQPEMDNGKPCKLMPRVGRFKNLRRSDVEFQDLIFISIDSDHSDDGKFLSSGRLIYKVTGALRTDYNTMSVEVPVHYHVRRATPFNCEAALKMMPKLKGINPDLFKKSFTMATSVVFHVDPALYPDGELPLVHQFTLNVQEGLNAIANGDQCADVIGVFHPNTFPKKVRRNGVLIDTKGKNYDDVEVTSRLTFTQQDILLNDVLEKADELLRAAFSQDGKGNSGFSLKDPLRDSPDSFITVSMSDRTIVPKARSSSISSGDEDSAAASRDLEEGDFPALPSPSRPTAAKEKDSRHFKNKQAAAMKAADPSDDEEDAPAATSDGDEDDDSSLQDLAQEAAKAKAAFKVVGKKQTNARAAALEQVSNDDDEEEKHDDDE